MKTLIVAAVLLALSSVPALAADKSKPERPDAKFLDAVDKAIAAAQEKAVPTPKLLKLAKVLIKKGRLIRANEVAELIARKKTDADQAAARKINTAVARCTSILGSWEIGKGRVAFHFVADGTVFAGETGRGRWERTAPGRYTVRFNGGTERFQVAGLNCTMVRTTAPDQTERGKRVK